MEKLEFVLSDWPQGVVKPETDLGFPNTTSYVLSVYQSASRV